MLKLTDLKMIERALNGDAAVRNQALAIVQTTIRSVEAKAASTQHSWAYYAPQFGLKVEDFGKIFHFRGRKYQVNGINPRAGAYPIEAKRLPDGKGFKFPARAVNGGMF